MAELDRIRRLSGPANFRAQYLQDPLAADLRIVDIGSFTFIDKPSQHELRAISIDPAST
jgi:hypothetical protein